MLGFVFYLCGGLAVVVEAPNIKGSTKAIVAGVSISCLRRSEVKILGRFSREDFRMVIHSDELILECDLCLILTSCVSGVGSLERRFLRDRRSVRFQRSPELRL